MKPTPLPHPFRLAVSRVAALLLCAAGLGRPLSAEEFSVYVYGALGDGETVSTKAIQKAIDRAGEEGGGTVVFPSGTYLSGALFLRDGVELRLDEGVVLSAVRDEAAFPAVPSRVSGIEMAWPSALINALGVSRARVSGSGVIDGQGDFWWARFEGLDGKGGLMADYRPRGLAWAADFDCGRVRTISAYNATDFSVEGVTILRPGSTAVNATYSTQVAVRHVTIKANEGGLGSGTNGIVIDSSSKVTVENCDIDCNADCIALKSGRDAEGLRVNRPVEDVVVRDCVTRAGKGMFVIGSETSGGVRNVDVANLRAIGTSHGLRFKSTRTRGGLVENIRIRGIVLENVPKPIDFDLAWVSDTGVPVLPSGVSEETIPAHWKALLAKVEPAAKGIARFRRISISGLRATGAEQAILVNANKEKPLEELTMDDVRIDAGRAGKVKGGSLWSLRDVVFTLRESAAEVPYIGCYDVPQPQLQYRR